jgi:hypothetical protein
MVGYGGMESDRMRQLLPFLFFLPFGLFIASMIVIHATLAWKLHRLAPQGMSRFWCAQRIGARPPAPALEGETEEFRERLIAYRQILWAMAILLMALTLIVSHILIR